MRIRRAPSWLRPPRARSWQPVAAAGGASGVVVAALIVSAQALGGPEAAVPDRAASLTPATSGITGPTAADPALSSGVIGPWQQMSHAHASGEIQQRVAADPRGVQLLGDSQATRIRAPLATALAAQGRPLAWDHWNGRPTRGSVDALLALSGQDRQPKTIVVVSGANDIFEPSDFPGQIERLMAVAGPDRPVYWVTPDVRRPAHLEADKHNSALLREALDAAAAAHPNLHLVRWAEEFAARPEAERTRLVPDGVHPSPAGAQAIVELVDRQLR